MSKLDDYMKPFPKPETPSPPVLGKSYLQQVREKYGDGDVSITAHFGYPEDPCPDCADGACTMGCSQVVKRLSPSGSFPYMAAARVYGVSYGDVLRAMDDPVGTHPMKVMIALGRADTEERRRRERGK